MYVCMYVCMSVTKSAQYAVAESLVAGPSLIARLKGQLIYFEEVQKCCSDFDLFIYR